MKSTTIAIGAEAPDLALPGVDGATHDLRALRGRPVLLVFYRGHW